MSLIPHESLYYEVARAGQVVCQLCPHRCHLKPGEHGSCWARENRDGTLFSLTYGKLTAVALDPVEKKPLYHFFPGRPILSVGGWGCNLKCVFCQNSSISQGVAPTREVSVEELAQASRENGSIGVAYTYNEPLVAFEYILDAARAVRLAGGKNVLVTNAYVNPEPLAELLPLIDAMNIDVKAFNEDFYHRLCRASLAPVLDTVREVLGKTHVELTLLLIPGENDAVPELEDMADWIAENCGRDIPTHITAYFPSYQSQRSATTAAHLVHARDIFRSRLDYVYAGNIRIPGGGDTSCRKCGETLIRRGAFSVEWSSITPEGDCPRCGSDNHLVLN
ncbi:MAG: AmmeMemoRadiSam system radical SAM enzyme [Planctomycetota bacterium]|jgi:pyruvate formate lyase activating enzyme|nr:AmmeMemoRadiSam system radical SAM enzyme [Planctomycetota bacterium]